ncbi:hypothetical protein [Enterovibrio norvegicus]|uniref:hypothetical protein n=1 Tax=Enterovibrio norvegicus TaxID=188144 RepID=UPI003550A8EC
MRSLCLGLLAAVSFSSLAINSDYVGSSTSTIVIVNSYSEYGGGDVYFTLASPADECPNGYWMRKTDPGFQANLSMVIAAYQAKSSVRIYGLPDEMWSGTSGKACRLYAISYR